MKKYIILIGLLAGCVNNLKYRELKDSSKIKLFGDRCFVMEENCNNDTNHISYHLKHESRRTVEVYFDPYFPISREYLKMIDKRRLEERFGYFKFDKICVELELFGQDGRCKNVYGQDGKSNYERLKTKCNGTDYKGSCGILTPTVFLENRYLANSWELETQLSNF